MASDTDTRNPDRIGGLVRRSLRELKALATSRIFRRIFLLHMLALVWLVLGIFLIAGLEALSAADDTEGLAVDTHLT